MTLYTEPADVSISPQMQYLDPKIPLVLCHVHRVEHPWLGHGVIGVHIMRRLPNNAQTAKQHRQGR